MLATTWRLPDQEVNLQGPSQCLKEGTARKLQTAAEIGRPWGTVMMLPSDSS